MALSCPYYSTSTIHTSCPQMVGMTARSSSITQLNLSPRDWAVLHTRRLSGVRGNISEVLFLSARDTAFPTTKISPLKYLKWPIHNLKQNHKNDVLFNSRSYHNLQGKMNKQLLQILSRKWISRNQTPLNDFPRWAGKLPG